MSAVNPSPWRAPRPCGQPFLEREAQWAHLIWREGQEVKALKSGSRPVCSLDMKGCWVSESGPIATKHATSPFKTIELPQQKRTN